MADIDFSINNEELMFVVSTLFNELPASWDFLLIMTQNYDFHVIVSSKSKTLKSLFL